MVRKVLKTVVAIVIVLVVCLLLSYFVISSKYEFSGVIKGGTTPERTTVSLKYKALPLALRNSTKGSFTIVYHGEKVECSFYSYGYAASDQSGLKAARARALWPKDNDFYDFDFYFNDEMNELFIDSDIFRFRSDEWELPDPA